MVTGTDPFSPRTPLTRETLERYAAGRLGPDERHEVELHLEADPFLREAAEGLQQPGAMEGLKGLRRPPMEGGRWPARLLGAGIIVGIVALVVLVLRIPEEDQRKLQAAVGGEPPKEDQPLSPAAVESTLAVVHAEIAASTPLPGSERTDRTRHDRFVQRDTVQERLSDRQPDADPVERIRPGAATVPSRPDTATKRPERMPRPSRQLVFLHDLKLVHPLELYGTADPPLPSPGVPADASDAQGSGLGGPPATMAYLDLMDEALGAFAAGRQQAALDDLIFLLGQYPDDINARFYAGLCCYDLGLFDRAQRLFRGVATDPVDTFNEEAEWYLALSTRRKDGRKTAEPLFQRIAGEGGFYAARARAELER